MKKTLIALILIISLFFSSIAFALDLNPIYKKIDKVSEKNPKALDVLETNLTKFKTKYSGKPELSGIIDDLLKYISDKKVSNTTQNTNKFEFVKVVDGDTITIKYEGKNTNIRMIWLDAPESSVLRFWEAECFWKEAAAQLSEYLSWATEVTLEFDASQGKLDKYNRLLAYVFYNGENMNAKMIRTGYAFEYTYDKAYKYQDEFKKNQTAAAAEKIGLWAGDTCNGIRKIQEVKKETSAEVINIIENTKTEEQTWSTQNTVSTPVVTPTYPSTQPSASSFSCSYKKTCGAMNSCEEAYYQLNTCGYSSLDRDKDGIPCESICK